MDTPQHRELAQAFIEAMGYPEDERVRAAFLVGSSATGETDAHSDVDAMMVVDAVIPDEERLQRMQAAGCHSIMLVIAGVDNPALPVASQVIDKFVFRDTWFDVSYHLPHQLGFCFDYVSLVDKDDWVQQLCRPDQAWRDDELRARVQANLRLLHVRVYRYEKYALREEWIGMDLMAIKNAIVDVLMVLNDRPNYNRHSSRISRLLEALTTKPEGLAATLEDILHLDNRRSWQHKLALMRDLEAELIALGEARWKTITMFDDGQET